MSKDKVNVPLRRTTSVESFPRDNIIRPPILKTTVAGKHLCTKCRSPIKATTTDAFQCGFCFEYQHIIGCTDGTCTPKEIEKIKSNQFFFICANCRTNTELNVSKKEPIAPLILGSENTKTIIRLKAKAAEALSKAQKAKEK